MYKQEPVYMFLVDEFEMAVISSVNSVQILSKMHNIQSKSKIYDWLAW